MAPKVAENVREGGADVTREGGLCRRETLQSPGGAEPETLAHQKPEVEGGGLNQDPFSNLHKRTLRVLAANVEATESSGYEQVRESPLQPLAASAQQPLAPDPPAVGVGRLPRVRFPFHFRGSRFGSLT